MPARTAWYASPSALAEPIERAGAAAGAEREDGVLGDGRDEPGGAAVLGSGPGGIGGWPRGGP